MPKKTPDFLPPDTSQDEDYKPSKMGAPKKTINWKEVDRLIAIGNNGKRIAAWFGIHPDTLEARCLEENGVTFSVYIDQKDVIGCAKLLDTAYTIATHDKNVTMLIFLLKNRLGYTDKVETAQHQVREIIYPKTDYQLNEENNS